MKKQSLRIKMALLCALLLGSLVGTGFAGLKMQDKIVDRLNDISDVQLPAVQNMTLADMMHDGLRAVAYRAIIFADSKDKEVTQEIRNELKEMSDAIKKYVDTISSLDVRPETKKAVELAMPEITAYVEVSSRIVDLALGGKKEEAMAKIEAFQIAFSALEKKMEVLGELIEKDSDASHEAGKAIAVLAKKIILAISLIGLGLGILASFTFVTSLSKQLNQIVDQLSLTAEGVAVTTEKVANSSQDLSRSTLEQASSLEETAASLEEITAMISKAANSAETTASSSFESQEKATQGRDVVNEMLTSMNEIRQSNELIMDQINETNAEMSGIIHLIKEIGDKTKVINEIVFQTKLLSFNASVEAARAGENGKGFAVVAEEVGSLAQMSGNASKEISDLLGASVVKVESIIGNTKRKVEALVADGKEKLDKGVEVAQQCSEILNEIVQNVSHVSNLAKDISTATTEQSLGVNEINKSISKLDSVTQRNSASGIKSAEAATDLHSQTETLKDAVRNLVVTIQGGDLAA